MNGKEIVIVSISALLSGEAFGVEANSAPSARDSKPKEESQTKSNDAGNILTTIEEIIGLLKMEEGGTLPCSAGS